MELKKLPKAKQYFFFSDVHGNWNALKQITQTTEWQDPNTQFVFLGDLFDGHDTSNELDFLAIWQFLYDHHDKILWVLGNHDQFMKNLLQATDSPESKDDLKHWFHSGGKGTLKQFGFSNADLAHLQPLFFKNELLKTRPELCDYLLSRPYGYYNDNIIAVHAGLNPLAWQISTLVDLIWTRDRFYNTANQSEHVVVIGHTPVQGILNDDTAEILMKGNQRYPIYLIDGGSSSGLASGCLQGLVLDQHGQYVKEYQFK